MVEHWTELPNGWRLPLDTPGDGRSACTHEDSPTSRSSFIAASSSPSSGTTGCGERSDGQPRVLHDRVLGALLPDILDCAGSLAEEAVGIDRPTCVAANDRSALVDELKQAADDRLALVEELHEVAAETIAALEASRARGGNL